MTNTTHSLEIQDGVVLLTFRRPDVLNALNSEAINNLITDLKQLSHNKSIVAMVVTGEGKGFIAGADIHELATMKQSDAYSFSRKGQQAFARLENADYPVIAAINGFALGGGLELALACDIRIAGSNAKMGMPETKLGLMPGFAGTQRLSRLIGYPAAMYLMATGRTIDANEALRLGLVQQVVPDEEVLPAALKIAGEIASNGKFAVRAVKEIARKSMATGFSDGCELESEAFAGLFDWPEAVEGMKAFLDKRKPEWIK